MIILYKGARGKGKTLTLVKDGLKYYNAGFRVLRNFDALFGEEVSNDFILGLNKNSDLFNCVLLIDEIQIFFDSRTSSAVENRRFSNFIQQIRKRNITILTTTQFSNTIDLRLRQHIDVLALPNFDKVSNVCECIYVDLTSLESSRKPSYFSIKYYALPIFPLYNTNQMVI